LGLLCLIFILKEKKNTKTKGEEEYFFLDFVFVEFLVIIEIYFKKLRNMNRKR
jgi:hypothetical protein